MPMFSQMHPVPMAAVFSQYQWDGASYAGMASWSSFNITEKMFLPNEIASALWGYW